MGNDTSKLRGLEIDRNAVEANDFWVLYNAEAPTTANEDGKQLLSVFQGESVVNGQLWVVQGPMERAIRNLMIYRHPYILKYNSTWEQGGQKYLATERVRPLISVLSTQTEIQVCLGLRTILCSLIFLIEKATARHLNLCISSIYITDNGSWRLAGFEYVWKSKEVTKALLDLANAYRYKPAIDTSETIDNNWDALEQYSFATLCEEILAKCICSATPYVQDFLEYCATHLKHKNAKMRPKLSAVLLHPYFNHEFVLIHSFMFELPVKSIQEKQDFFASLIDRLRYFKEEVVGAQLAGDLLSRMVLTDPTAQLCVTPYVLKTKTEHSAALFSNSTYTKYLMPHILKMFRLRDAQIRLILLEYFMEFVRLLTKADLEEFILPHLLAGMNDINDVLVAKTLRCLADLVPILGSAKVIGGNRLRLFSDGRPQAAVPDSTTHWVEPRSITPVMGSNDVFMVSSSPLPDNTDMEGSFVAVPPSANVDLQMSLRLSPDGGEDNETTSSYIYNQQRNISDDDDDEVEKLVYDLIESMIGEVIRYDDNDNKNNAILAIECKSAREDVPVPDIEDDEAWSDWETDELQRLNGDASTEFDLPTPENQNTLPAFPLDLMSQNLLGTVSSSYATLPSQISLTDSYRTTQSNTSSLHSLKPPKINDDLNALDIKVQSSATPSREQSSEFDFFKDMEPVIETQRTSLLSTTNHIPDSMITNTKNNFLTAIDDDIIIDSSRFAALSNDLDGWGEEGDDANDWKVY